ncbi:dihydrofolate reductase family protein [Saccharopolyspora mangrovi]|uniref:Dihydrofolate reductase family protein n=1 Tax=Saccharopolyspora mangrovi TaxID=3082379 RepID=A0ABU6ALC2_9PSEU|nr:dihydrofolate reductase family protein [Saccharopolyspora sp. S2-29]MEB3372354.1 dihydrofolate reductase family protein [Saccharopolyspora sp. S2-29]
MRRMTYMIASTIDGRITGPDNGNPDFFLHEGDHGEFLREEFPELLPTHVRPVFGIDGAANKHFDTVLQGRGSWDIGMREGVTNAYRHLRSIVFSRSITESPDPTVEFVSGAPCERVRELKREPGAGIWLCGGGRLAATLRPEIDDIIVKLHPVVAGSGIPLFDGEFSPEQFDLVEAKPFTSGVLHLHYRRP